MRWSQCHLPKFYCEVSKEQVLALPLIMRRDELGSNEEERVTSPQMCGVRSALSQRFGDIVIKVLGTGMVRSLIIKTQNFGKEGTIVIPIV